jgi:hypothetical protein
MLKMVLVTVTVAETNQIWVRITEYDAGRRLMARLGIRPGVRVARPGLGSREPGRGLGRPDSSCQSRCLAPGRAARRRPELHRLHVSVPWFKLRGPGPQGPGPERNSLPPGRGPRWQALKVASLSISQAGL